MKKESIFILTEIKYVYMGLGLGMDL